MMMDDSFSEDSFLDSMDESQLSLIEAGLDVSCWDDGDDMMLSAYMDTYEAEQMLQMGDSGVEADLEIESTPMFEEISQEVSHLQFMYRF